MGIRMMCLGNTSHLAVGCRAPRVQAQQLQVHVGGVPIGVGIRGAVAAGMPLCVQRRRGRRSARPGGGVKAVQRSLDAGAAALSIPANSKHMVACSLWLGAAPVREAKLASGTSARCFGSLAHSTDRDCCQDEGHASKHRSTRNTAEAHHRCMPSARRQGSCREGTTAPSSPPSTRYTCNRCRGPCVIRQSATVSWMHMS